MLPSWFAYFFFEIWFPVSACTAASANYGFSLFPVVKLCLVTEPRQHLEAPEA